MLTTFNFVTICGNRLMLCLRLNSIFIERYYGPHQYEFVSLLLGKERVRKYLVHITCHADQECLLSVKWPMFMSELNILTYVHGKVLFFVLRFSLLQFTNWWFLRGLPCKWSPSDLWLILLLWIARLWWHGVIECIGLMNIWVKINFFKYRSIFLLVVLVLGQVLLYMHIDTLPRTYGQ